MELWIYFSNFHCHAWVYPEEPVALPFDNAQLLAVWEFEEPNNTAQLRRWIERQVRVLGYDPPFININFEHLTP